MAEKSVADLTTDNTNDIGSQTAPDSITPTIDAARRKDIIDSQWNKTDGIRCQFASIPAAYTGIVAAGTVGNFATGDELNDIIFKIMDRTSALQDLIEGGVQGKINEFLAMITTDTNQAVLTTTGNTSYVSAAVVKLVNDADNGGFDNGNNWLVSKYTVPAGVTAAKFSASALAFKLLENNISIGAAWMNFKYVITQNGTVVASGNEIQINNGDPVDVMYYLDDFNTGVITVAQNDIISLEFYQNHPNSSTATTLHQLTNGFFHVEL